MALINCVECGKEISDQALACPHCGVPMNAEISEASKRLSDRYVDEKGKSRQPYRWELEKEGIVPPKKNGNGAVVVLAIVTAVVGLYVLGLVLPVVSVSNDSNTTRERKTVSEQVYQCSGTHRMLPRQYAQDFVRKRLKNPRDARFSGVFSSTEREIEPCVFIVKGWVEATNGFGGTIRSNYYVKLKRNASEWQAVQVVID